MTHTIEFTFLRLDPIDFVMDKVAPRSKVTLYRNGHGETWLHNDKNEAVRCDPLFEHLIDLGWERYASLSRNRALSLLEEAMERHEDEQGMGSQL